MSEQKKQTAVVRKKAFNPSEAIAIMSKDGSVIRQIKTAVKLSVDDGTLVKMPGMNVEKNGQWVQLYIPSASGFMQQAQHCGLILDHPETVIVNDRAQPNGFQDDKGRIYFRSRCGGYTALGTPFVIDRTVCLDVELYNLQDLISKAGKAENKAFFKIMPFRGVDGDGMMKGGPGETWAGYRIDAATVLWVNCDCPQFITWTREMVNRRKNAIRTCQTFADRNAIAAHPALPPERKFTTPTAVVETTMWYAEKGVMRFDGSTMNVDLTKLLAAGGEKPEVDNKVIDINAEISEGRLSTAEVGASTAEVIEEGDVQAPDEDDDLPLDDPEQSDEPPKAAEAAPAASPKQVQVDALIASIEKMRTHKKITYRKACAELGIDPEGDLVKVDEVKLVKLMKAMEVK